MRRLPRNYQPGGVPPPSLARRPSPSLQLARRQIPSPAVFEPQNPIPWTWRGVLPFPAARAEPFPTCAACTTSLLALHFISTGVSLGPSSDGTPWPPQESTRARARIPRPSDAPHRCSGPRRPGPPELCRQPQPLLHRIWRQQRQYMGSTGEVCFCYPLFLFYFFLNSASTTANLASVSPNLFPWWQGSGSGYNFTSCLD
jgi:hypothetical protein